MNEEFYMAIQREAIELLKRVKLPLSSRGLPFEGYGGPSRGGEGFYVKADDQGYHLIYSERGEESIKCSTPDRDEFLFRICETSILGAIEEFASRLQQPGETYRASRLRHLSREMHRIRPEWGEKILETAAN